MKPPPLLLTNISTRPVEVVKYDCAEGGPPEGCVVKATFRYTGQYEDLLPFSLTTMGLTHTAAVIKLIGAVRSTCDKTLENLDSEVTDEVEGWDDGPTNAILLEIPTADYELLVKAAKIEEQTVEEFVIESAVEWAKEILSDEEMPEAGAYQILDETVTFPVADSSYKAPAMFPKVFTALANEAPAKWGLKTHMD